MKQRHIQWIPFTLVYTERELTSWGERMQMLKDLGMNPVERERIDHPTTEISSWK